MIRRVLDFALRAIITLAVALFISAAESIADIILGMF